MCISPWVRDQDSSTGSAFSKLALTFMPFVLIPIFFCVFFPQFPLLHLYFLFKSFLVVLTAYFSMWTLESAFYFPSHLQGIFMRFGSDLPIHLGRSGSFMVAEVFTRNQACHCICSSRRSCSWQVLIGTCPISGWVCPWVLYFLLFLL